MHSKRCSVVKVVLATSHNGEVRGCKAVHAATEHTATNSSSEQEQMARCSSGMSIVSHAPGHA
eukprot:scaffold19911_cov59-Phaeocystis_antarctica.AAC.4